MGWVTIRDYRPINMNTYCTRTPDLGNWELPLKPCYSVLLKINFKSNQKFHRPFSPLRRWSSRSCPTTCWARSGSCRTWTRTACSTPTSSASPCTSWTSSSTDTTSRRTSPRIWCRPPSADSKQLWVWWDLVLGRFCFATTDSQSTQHYVVGVPNSSAARVLLGFSTFHLYTTLP